MTTIVYDKGILAYDSRVTADGVIQGHINKGIKTESHLVAISGDFKAVALFTEWAKVGLDPDKAPKVKGISFEAVVVDRKGVVSSYDDSTVPVILDDKTYAAGSGKYYAQGALHAGATAKQAVIAAAAFDPLTGGQVREISFGK